MKDPHWISFSPSFHWTEQKLRVHILYCVLALTMASLLQKKAAEQNLRLSVDHLFTELSGIREVLNFMASEPGKRGALRTTYVLTWNRVSPCIASFLTEEGLRPTFNIAEKGSAAKSRISSRKGPPKSLCTFSKRWDLWTARLSVPASIFQRLDSLRSLHS